MIVALETMNVRDSRVMTGSRPGRGLVVDTHQFPISSDLTSADASIAGRSARGFDQFEYFAAHQQSQFGGRQRLLAFAQRVQPEIRARQHLKQIFGDSAEADLGLLDIVGDAALGGESRMPSQSLEFDGGDIELLP